MMRTIVASILLSMSIIGFAVGRPPVFAPDSDEQNLSAETKQLILQLGDEILRISQAYVEPEREDYNAPSSEASYRRHLGWGPLEQNSDYDDETAAAVEELATYFLEGVLTAVKELHVSSSSSLEQKPHGESSEVTVSMSDEDAADNDKPSKPSVYTNNVLYDDSAHNFIVDVENSLQSEETKPARELFYKSDNTEDNRLVKRDTAREREIEAFLSELDKDIDKQNKGKHDVTSYVGSQYSVPKQTTTARPFWKKIGDAFSSSYDKVKSKTKQVVTSVRGQF